MKKLFKWPGGKKQETKRIVELLPQTIDTVVEPFAGSAAIAFHLEKKSCSKIKKFTKFICRNL